MGQDELNWEEFKSDLKNSEILNEEKQPRIKPLSVEINVSYNENTDSVNFKLIDSNNKILSEAKVNKKYVSTTSLDQIGIIVGKLVAEWLTEVNNLGEPKSFMDAVADLSINTAQSLVNGPDLSPIDDIVISDKKPNDTIFHSLADSIRPTENPED